MIIWALKTNEMLLSLFLCRFFPLHVLLAFSKTLGLSAHALIFLHLIYHMDNTLLDSRLQDLASLNALCGEKCPQENLVLRIALAPLCAPLILPEN